MLHAHIHLGTWERERLCESVGIGVIFCWCQLARGPQINVCVCMRAHAYVQTKAPSQTPVNRLARLRRNKGLRENADFTGKGRGGSRGCARLVFWGVCVRGERGPARRWSVVIPLPNTVWRISSPGSAANSLHCNSPILLLSR